MANLQSKNTITPFLRVSAGECFIVKLLARELVSVKGEDRDCLRVEVYYAGKREDGALPGSSEIVKALCGSPVESLIGANKAITDALFQYNDKNELVSDPTGGYFVFTYDGKQKIAGGKSFNSWGVYAVTLTAAERQKIAETHSVE